MPFHLSLPVPALQASADFFTNVLGAKVVHADDAGYVNLDLAGVQLTLTETHERREHGSGLHFGVDLDLAAFGALEERVKALAPDSIEKPAHTVDAGTPRERRKMYLRCPAGYRIEIKGRETERSRP